LTPVFLLSAIAAVLSADMAMADWQTNKHNALDVAIRMLLK
jgi:hypothetical protein